MSRWERFLAWLGITVCDLPVEGGAVLRWLEEEETKNPRPHATRTGVQNPDAAGDRG